ncbi:uncharacterized protein LOC132045948 [Lycium ferocissimum]|uniref:uncharacterized protein LOC132045948 n=1 Tax=Lycium ferocissimum TaxID=112874 RepID=UPI002814C964|nr:uncharacterized protein LOC132045948 [Lycium ferocissimum]
MAAPPNLEEGKSQTRPPRFNGNYYGWWKTRMPDYIMDEDSELQDIIYYGSFVPMKTDAQSSKSVPEIRKEYSETDRKAIEKNYKAKKILICGIGPDEYNRISSCGFAKVIWEAIQTTHEGTTQVKQFKIDLLTAEYSWERKVNAITEAKDLQTLTLDELIGKLKTCEMKRNKDLERREPKNEKSQVLKAAKSDTSSDESEMAYLTRRFYKMILRNGGVPKRGSFSRKFKGNDYCQKCGKPGHFIKECPLHNESEDGDDAGDTSMLAIDSECSGYESSFSLMAKSKDDDDNEKDEANFFDVKKNLKSYSQKKLVSLENVLIDAYHSLINQKNALSEEIDEFQVRDDLVVTVVDLKEQVE